MGRISLSVVLALTTSSIATAQGVPVTWARQHDAETCADETRILRQVSRLLARGEHIVGDARRVHGTVTRNETGFVATLSLEEHGRHIGVRILRAPRCSMLEEQVVFVTYLLLSSPAPELNVSTDGADTPRERTDAPAPESTEPPSVLDPSAPAAGPGPAPRTAGPQSIEPEATELIEAEPMVEVVIVRDQTDRDASAYDVPEAPDPALPPRPFVFRFGVIGTADYVPGVWAGGIIGFGWTRNRFRLDLVGGWLPYDRQRVDSVTLVRRQVAPFEVRLCHSFRRRGAVTFSGCGAVGLPLAISRVEGGTGYGGRRQVGLYVAPVGVMTLRVSRRLNLGLEMTMPLRVLRHALSAQNERGVEVVISREGVVAFATALVLGFEFGKLR